MNQTENQLMEERRRAEGYKKSLHILLRDIFPLMACMTMLGCILGTFLSGWIFFVLGG